MILPRILNHFLQKNRSAWLPGRVELQSPEEQFEEDGYRDLVYYYVERGGVTNIVVGSGFEGGGMNYTQKRNLRAFLDWCQKKYPALTITLAVHHVTKGCFHPDLAAGLELQPDADLSCDLQGFQVIGSPRQFYLAYFGAHADQHRDRIYHLRLRITGGTCRLLWFRSDGELENSKYTDINDPALWEQQRIPGTDEYVIPLSTHGGGEYSLLLETRSGTPRYEFIACNEATADELAPFTINGKYLGNLAGRGGLNLTIPYTVPGLQMDYSKSATIKALSANAQAVADFIADLPNVTALHIHGDEPKIWTSHQAYVDAMHKVAALYRTATGKPIECWGDALCGHNSDFAGGVYANLPSPRASDWKGTKSLTLDVWGPAAYLATSVERPRGGLGDAHEWGASRYNIGLSPHWDGGEEAVVRAQASAVSNFTISQLLKLSLGHIRIRDYAENFDQAFRAHERFSLFTERLLA